MTRNEAIFELIKYRRRLEEDPTIIFGRGSFDAEPFDMAIEALDKPIPKPHDRLMFWETARRIIDSPRSKEQMLAVLDSVPPVEALERKHGDWIPHEMQVPWGDGTTDVTMFRCSVCGYEQDWQSKFCPNCGADMRGDECER